ncbi:MAG TPA: M1 family aminopeptidase [Thermoanaerobaculia bacterium]|nr:M1 family aminopeptidase [Thermoanaerobaculia bacterium]
MKTRTYWLGAALLLLATHASGATVAGLIEAFASARLAPETTAVSNVTIKHESIDLSLTSGNAALIMVGDQAAGFFFKGNGSFAYTSSEPVEQPVLASNLKRATKLSGDSSGGATRIQDSFNEILVWWLGAPMPDLAGTAGSVSMEKEFAAHRENFSREWGAPVTHRIVQRELNSGAGKFIRAEMTGGKETVAYEYDQAEDHQESFYTLERAGGTVRDIRNRLVPIPLSEQPIGRSAKQPPVAPFLLTHVDYTLIASEGDDANLTVTETITANVGGLSTVRLDLYSERFDDKVRQRKYNVRSVKDEAGKELSFEHREGSLIVGLPRPLAAGASTKLTFAIDGDFLIRPQGGSFWQLGVEPWFPMPDLNGQYYTLHSVVKVKKPYIAFAPGKTIRREEEGDYNVIENVIDKPVQFAVVHAGKYHYEEETRGGVTVRVATYALKNKRAIKQLSDLAFGVMEYYDWFLGPFPFSELNILQIDSYGFGQAPPGTMFITNEAFNPTMGELNQLFSQGINERFAHEIAHQYWGHVVKMPSGEEQWLTESFAEYCAALFLKKLKGERVYKQMLRDWESRSRRATASAPIPMANRVRIPGDRILQNRERTSLVYFKGAYLLAHLHEEMGDTAFLSFLKSYQKSFNFKFGTSQDVAGLLQFITKKDYQPYMDRYFWGTELPEMN